MKKTFPVNINGKIFYIDEDAYKLLLDYLSQLRATFTGDEGTEIVDDIESRISEHFDERVRLGANVITLDDVNRVIETMGRPDQLSDESDESTHADSDSASTANTGDSTTATPPRYNAAEAATAQPVNKKLYRDVRHSVFGGVIAGLAQYLNWDVTIMRILAVVLTICTYFWPCVIVYLIAWMIIPIARTPREILEMQGQPVTIDNVGQTVINNATAPSTPNPNPNPSPLTAFINTFFSIAAKFILGFIAIVFSITSLTLICVILVAIAGISIFYAADNPMILDWLDWLDTNAPILESWGNICTIFAVLIPILIALRYSCAHIFKTKTPSKSVITTAIVFEIIFIIAAVVLLAFAEQPDYIIESSTTTILTDASTLDNVSTIVPTTVGTSFVLSA